MDTKQVAALLVRRRLDQRTPHLGSACHAPAMMAERQPSREHARRRRCRGAFLATGISGNRRRYWVCARTIVIGAFVIAVVVVPNPRLRPQAPCASSSFASSNQQRQQRSPATRRRRPQPPLGPCSCPILMCGTKSSSLVFSNNTPMTSSSPPLSVTREGCMPPNLRTGELASTASFPGLLLPPLRRTDGSIVRHQRTRRRRVCTGTRTTDKVRGAPVD